MYVCTTYKIVSVMAFAKRVIQLIHHMWCTEGFNISNVTIIVSVLVVGM